MLLGSKLLRCSACVALVYLCYTAASSVWMKEPYSGVHSSRVAQAVGNEPSIVPSPTPAITPDVTDQPVTDTPDAAATLAPTPAVVVEPTVAPTPKARKTVGPTPAPTGETFFKYSSSACASKRKDSSVLLHTVQGL
jgi:hypothetical protein